MLVLNIVGSSDFSRVQVLTCGLRGKRENGGALVLLCVDNKPLFFHWEDRGAKEIFLFWCRDLGGGDRFWGRGGGRGE